MLKLSKKEEGAGALEVILIIVIVAVIAFVGYYIYHTSKKTNSTYNSSATTSSTGKVGSYVGWKSYCDSASGGCFKYPSSWTLSTSASGVQVVSSTKGATVTYSPVAASVTPDSFTTVSFHQLAKPISGLEVVGGYYATNNAPTYALVDSSLVKTDGLKVGQTTANVGALTYNSTASFVAADTASSSSKLNTEQSRLWLRSADGTQSALVLESYYKQ